MPDLMRLGILDDYQGVALQFGPWDRQNQLRNLDRLMIQRA